MHSPQGKLRQLQFLRAHSKLHKLGSFKLLNCFIFHFPLYERSHFTICFLCKRTYKFCSSISSPILFPIVFSTPTLCPTISNWSSCACIINLKQIKRKQHNLLITITFYVTCKVTWRNSNMILMKQYFVASASCIPAVFSLSFSSAPAGEEPFIAGKTKNMHQRCTFLGTGG